MSRSGEADREIIQPRYRTLRLLREERLTVLGLKIQQRHRLFQRQFLGFGRPAIRLPTRAGEPGNSLIR